MAKVSIKSEKITAFGGIFFVLDKFDHILSSVIDSHLGLRRGAKGTGPSAPTALRPFARVLASTNGKSRLNLFLQRISDICIDGKAGLQSQHRNLTVNSWRQSDIKHTCITLVWF